MTKYLGIDYSSHSIHYVYLDESGRATYHPYELTGADAFERTRSVRDALPPRTSYADEGVVAAGIEEPMARGKLSIQLTPKLKAIQGAILACLPPWLLVNQMTAPEWRKAVGLAGNASKADVAELVVRVPGSSVTWTQDACDAYCLALAVSKLTEDVAA